jgi:hypothetical protein
LSSSGLGSQQLTAGIGSAQATASSLLGLSAGSARGMASQLQPLKFGPKPRISGRAKLSQHEDEGTGGGRRAKDEREDRVINASTTS